MYKSFADALVFFIKPAQYFPRKSGGADEETMRPFMEIALSYPRTLLRSGGPNKSIS